MNGIGKKLYCIAVFIAMLVCTSGCKSVPKANLSQTIAQDVGEKKTEDIFTAVNLPTSFRDVKSADLAPLRHLARNARVFGIGEGAHFVNEFALGRMQFARFLIEACGFTHVALEVGEREAAGLNPWLQGAGKEDELEAKTTALTYGLYGDFLRWLRSFNVGRKYPVVVLGPDLPNDMDLLSEIKDVIQYLRIVDAEAARTLDAAQAISAKIKTGSPAVAAPIWQQLKANEKFELTASLSRIYRRMDALKPYYVAKSDETKFQKALRQIKTACDIDYMLNAMASLFSGVGLVADTSIRDTHIATSILNALAADDKMRVLYVAHNLHIQKTPVSFGDFLAAYTAGYYLSRALGNAYRAVAFTHVGNKVPEMNFPAPKSPVGFTVEMVDLSAPLLGSVENLIIEAGFAKQSTLIDLTVGVSAFLTLNQIRSQSANVDTPLTEAFDAILITPEATQTKGLLY